LPLRELYNDALVCEAHHNPNGATRHVGIFVGPRDAVSDSKAMLLWLLRLLRLLVLLGQ